MRRSPKLSEFFYKVVRGSPPRRAETDHPPPGEPGQAFSITLASAITFAPFCSITHANPTHHAWHLGLTHGLFIFSSDCCLRTLIPHSTAPAAFGGSECVCCRAHTTLPSGITFPATQERNPGQNKDPFEKQRKTGHSYRQFHRTMPAFSSRIRSKSLRGETRNYFHPLAKRNSKPEY